MELLDRVRRTITRHALAGPDTRLVLALSGGSDSVALVHLLMALHARGELHVATIAHFNHQLRGTAADADEAFCARLAASLGFELVVDRGDVAALARRDRLSTENAARTARHAFLERVRVAHHADAIALGHTRDDQAETFLLRLLRGAGAKGLGSMYPRAGAVVRPLLGCRRAELSAYLTAHGQSFVHDDSNDDVSIPRNRVRAELLPLMTDRFNPGIVDVLAGEADIARDEHEYLNAVADDLWRTAVRGGPGEVRIDRAALSGAARAVGRLVVRRAMVQVANDREVGSGDVERALELALGYSGNFDGPGQRVERIGPEVVLTGRSDRPADSAVVSAARDFRYALSLPGSVRVEEANRVMSAEIAPSWNGTLTRTDSASTAIVQLAGLPGPLTIRNRRPGDRFSPLGLGGWKKLQDFFVDRKVARADRDRVPLVVDEQDRIVWVAGHAIDEAFRVIDPAQAVIILRLKGVGGSV